MTNDDTTFSLLLYHVDDFEAVILRQTFFINYMVLFGRVEGFARERFEEDRIL